MPVPRSCLYCPTILSRYNGDYMCGPCKQEERSLSSKELKRRRRERRNLLNTPVRAAISIPYKRIAKEAGRPLDSFTLTKEEREAYYSGEWMGEEAMEMMEGEG